MLRGWLADSQRLSTPISHCSVLQPTAAVFTSGRLWGRFQRNSARVPASVSSLTAPLSFMDFLLSLFLLFCVTFMMQSVTHHNTVPTMMETLGKSWCHNVCIINKMMSSRTVPSWRKHGTVRPSRLNRPLPFLTTGPICSLTHAGLHPGACCMFWFCLTASFTHCYTLLPRIKVSLGEKYRLLRNAAFQSSGNQCSWKTFCPFQGTSHFHEGTLSHLLSVK